MVKVDLTPAFLIHRRPFKESSLLLDFFTLEHGKLRLVGNGARKSKTNIQMFQRLNISFSGKSELKTLTNFEADDVPRLLKGETLILGIYANELIARLLHEHDAHPQIFASYQQFVTQLSVLEKYTHHWLLRLFENDLLSQLGYELDLLQDVNGHPIDNDSFYDYQSQAGFLLNTEGKISGSLIKQLRQNSIENMPNVEQLRTCRNLNRMRLNPLLGNRPLQSRSLFFKN